MIATTKMKELKVGDDVWVMNDKPNRDGRTYKVVAFLENGYIKLNFRGWDVVLDAADCGVVKAVVK